MATTPIDKRVGDAMMMYLDQDSNFANPSSLHQLGQVALRAVDDAREKVALAVNAKSSEVIFTSGATESNNLAILGASEFYQRKGKHLITMQTEHSAVLDCFKHLETKGFEVSYLKPNRDGLIDLLAIEEAIREDTILISIMQVNNEIGVIQPIKEIAQLLKGKRIILHLVAAQSVGKLMIDVQDLDIDLMSFSAHKVYGPKGCGALYIRSKPRVRLMPIIYGGGQEQALRPGTLATHQIVGMGEAFEIAKNAQKNEYQHVTRLRDIFLKNLAVLDGVIINGSVENRVPHNLNVSFSGVDGESLLLALSDLCVSTTSACHAASLAPSHVLTAIGVSEIQALSSMRISFGRFTTNDQISIASERIINEVTRLRKLAS